MKKEGMW